MTKCNKCKNFGFCFDKPNYLPIQFIEGNPKAPIWIIGLNPKEDEDKKEREMYKNETKKDLLNRFDGNKPFHSYFKDFKKVNLGVYNGLKSGKVAHVDLVKCWSKKWDSKNSKKLIENCLPYLEKQIKKYNPKFILCNGSQVSENIKKIIPIKKDYGTYYIGKDKKIVALSGFIGRIDDYAKNRLGKEIQILTKKYKIINLS